MATSNEPQKPWYLRSSVPVLFPTHNGFDISMPQSSFDALVQDVVRLGDTAQEDDIEDDLADDMEEAKDGKSDKDDSLTLLSAAPSQGTQGAPAQLDLITTAETQSEEPSTIEPDKPEESQSESPHPFIQGLLSHQHPEAMSEGDMENKMLTENADIAYRSTTSPIVDLFSEMEEVVSGPRLLQLLDAAWGSDPLATLKIIFNARSIHLGKASRTTFYRCAGWLAQHHPLTLIANLRWLSRPVIQTKVDKGEKTDETDPEMVIVDVKPERDVDDMTRFDVKYGVSHGYWKDLLNILVLGVQGCLHVLCHPNNILYVERPQKPSQDAWAKPYDARTHRRNQFAKALITWEGAKAKRHSTRYHRHKQAIETFNSNGVYRGLYLTVARLFAEQLKTDLALLKGEDPKAKKNISLCAKWAPSHDRFHDKHTFIVSSIAEMLHPMAEVNAGDEHMDRERYLRHARESYRKDTSALRAHLDIVERKLSAKAYDKIAYDRVPSWAMNNYAKIFAEKDGERFEEYLNGVAQGKMHISGATLLPSTLIKPLRNITYNTEITAMNMTDMLTAKVADAQWKTLVQRIKDSGTLQSSIAVCDVSGSMEGPMFNDGTCPIDSAVGLSLLLAEVTAPPFGGHFITFSADPQVERIDLSKPLHEKISQLRQSNWDMNTNFVAVFEHLILPMAIRNELSQEDMVKRVFVFSDMQFDAADRRGGLFSSSFERIKRSYADSGYEMPELIFWNLAGGRAGYGAGTDGDPTAPKPVTSEETGTAIVSGYSQAMLKMFLDNGSFEDDGEEEENIKTMEEGDAVVLDSEAPVKKRRLDPMSAVKKAINHKAYDPLVVMD